MNTTTTIYDTHTHILPGIDDGAKSIQESIKLLQNLHKQSVSHVLLTPHFYSNKQPVETFIKQRNEAYQLLLSNPDIPKDIHLYLSAEVHLSYTLFNAKDITCLMIPGTNCILTELPYTTELTDSVLTQIKKLIYNKNARPVLAHIERYPFFFKCEKLIPELISNGCLLQTDLNSIEHLSIFHRRKYIKWFNMGWIHCFGTDCHNLTNRNADYSKYIQALSKYVDMNILNDISAAKELF